MYPHYFVMNKIELKTGTVEIDHKGVLWTRFRDKATVELEDAKLHAQAIMALCKGIRRPFVVDGRDIMGMITDEAQAYLASHPGIQQVRAAQAFITNSLGNRLMASIFIKLHRPKNPTKIFNNSEKALQWLAQYN